MTRVSRCNLYTIYLFPISLINSALLCPLYRGDSGGLFALQTVGLNEEKPIEASNRVLKS
jgi:hypothetical protein